jgi:hypothetical protein
MYMQFGCSAWLEIIQVSDHPVAPSSGLTASIAGSLPARLFTWYCQVVPIVMSPAAKAVIWSANVAPFQNCGLWVFCS